jgi:hypothetical protein
MKRALILSCFVMASAMAQAQFFGTPAAQPAPAEAGNRIFFGGNFGMNFGSNTFVNLSPIVGYRINDYFSAGGGVNFIYSSFTVKNGSGNKMYSDIYGTAGLGTFVRVYPVHFLFAQVRPELNYVWGKTKYYYNNIPESKYPGAFIPSLLVGGGLALPAGRGSLMVSLNYDVVQNKRSPYGTAAFVNFGFNF